MLEADVVVCTDCGNLHMEGGQAPADVDACVVCDGHVDDVELDDVIGF
jgi:hypothetical protein